MIKKLHKKEPWSENKQQVNILGYNKNISFVCLKSTIIIMKLLQVTSSNFKLFQVTSSYLKLLEVTSSILQEQT